MTPEERQIAIEERRRYQREYNARLKREHPDKYRERQLQTFLNMAKKRKAQEERQRILDDMEKEKKEKR